MKLKLKQKQQQQQKHKQKQKLKQKHKLKQKLILLFVCMICTMLLFWLEELWKESPTDMVIVINGTGEWMQWLVEYRTSLCIELKIVFYGFPPIC